MRDTVEARIRANPKYQELKRKRSAFGWWLTLLMMVVYYGYIALIAWNKPFLAQPLGAGVTTLGGYVISRLGYIPEEGEELKIGRYRAVVTGSDGRRITQILLTRLPEEQEEE